ncbi:MAG: hypothetical protein WC421_10735 [Elusimicrobiales bacterium]
MNEHEKQILNLLAESFRAGDGCGCSGCARLNQAAAKADNWFAGVRVAEEPPYLESRVLARLEDAPAWSGWLRMLVPASAAAAAAFGAWLWISSAAQPKAGPVEELVLPKGDGITAAAIAGESSEPLAFLNIDGEEAV